MDKATLPNRTLAALYRFAWLLTGQGEAAEQALAKALCGAESHLEEVRSETSREAWLLQRLRQACLAFSPAAADDPSTPRLLREETFEAPEILEIEAYIVAQRFHALPEPERTALALFYLELLPLSESARLLGLSLEQFCEALGRARSKLREKMHVRTA